MSPGTPAAETIAITGGTGLIGRPLVQQLLAAGYSLRLLTRGSAVPLPGVEYVVGDLRSTDSLRQLVHGATAVVHLAGVAHTTLDTAEAIAAARAVNVEATRTLVEAAAAAGTPRFVFMSSAHVYRGQRGLDLTEASPTAKDASYASMKLDAEAAVLELEHSRPGSTVILRPCLVYGPGVRFNLDALMRAVQRRFYVHPANRRVLRSMVSVDTLTAAVAFALANPAVAGIFNVADEEPVELRAWVNEIANRMQVARPFDVPYPVLQLAATVGSVARAAGLPSPLTRATVAKLTEPFTISTGKLRASGFVWPQTRGAVLQSMVDAFLRR